MRHLFHMLYVLNLASFLLNTLSAGAALGQGLYLAAALSAAVGLANGLMASGLKKKGLSHETKKG